MSHPHPPPSLCWRVVQGFEVIRGLKRPSRWLVAGRWFLWVLFRVQASGEELFPAQSPDWLLASHLLRYSMGSIHLKMVLQSTGHKSHHSKGQRNRTDEDFPGLVMSCERCLLLDEVRSKPPVRLISRFSVGGRNHPKSPNLVILVAFHRE